MAGMPTGYTFENILSAKMCDMLEFIAWTKTKDAEHNKNRPRSIVEVMMEQKKEAGYVSFNTPEAFEAERARIIKDLRSE